MWELLTALATIAALVVTHWLNKEKSRIEKAREIVSKNRAKLAREKYNAQIKDTESMEKDHDALMAELAAVLSVRSKGTPPTK